MRSLHILAVTVATIAITGCEDAIGPGGSCRAEMNNVRREWGQPDHRQTGSQAGDHMEQWRYHATGARPGRIFTFRWGSSYDGCVVQDGPLSSLEPPVTSLPARVLRSDD